IKEPPAGSPHSVGGPSLDPYLRTGRQSIEDAPRCHRVGGSDDNTELSSQLATRASLSLNAGQIGHRKRGSQASRMAATPWPPAAQIEIRPRTGLPPFFALAACSCLASWARIRPPVAANG